MSEELRVLPDDGHNRKLVDNVHPPQWVNPEPAPRYNMVVLGAGTAGLVCAAGAAGLGAKVALVERNLMGGDCLNVGCVPSKALLRSARAAHDVHAAGQFGVRVPDGVEVDFAAVMERMRRIRASIAPHDSARRFTEHYGVDVFFGQARFAGPQAVEVDGARLEFARAVVATGARPVVPPIPGLADAGFLTNETVFSLTELPRRLAVIGGGPIGCELAQAFARFGSQVTLVEMMPQFLGREDQEAAAVLLRALREDGVDVRLSTRLERVSRSAAGAVLELESGGQAERLEVDAVLVGVGRAPNVEGIGLEHAGVRFSAQGVEVDDFLRTSNRRIFACGDVCLPFKFTHTADAAARIVVQNALFGFAGKKRLSRLVVPWVTYTDPELAHVGITTREASDRGIGLDTYTVPLAEVDRAIADGDEHGFVKIHTKRGSDRVLGATVVARHAGDMLSEITTAIVHGVGLGALAGVIHPYPTQAEAIRKAGDAYNHTRLTPTVAALMRRLLAWRR